MRLTRAGEYAIRCVLFLSRCEEGRLVRRREVADKGDIPSQFLAKIAQQLARAGIIEIIQGPRGGYRLIKKPVDITLLAVIEAMIGEILLNDCVGVSDSCKPSCESDKTCTINKVWTKARNQLRATLREVTFDMLVEDKTCCVISGNLIAPDGFFTGQ